MCVVCDSRYVCCNQHHDWERDRKAGPQQQLYYKWDQWDWSCERCRKGLDERTDSVFPHSLGRDFSGVFQPTFTTLMKWLEIKQTFMSHFFPDPAGSSEVWFCGDLPVRTPHSWIHNSVSLSCVCLSTQTPVWSQTSSLCWSFCSHLCEYES